MAREVEPEYYGRVHVRYLASLMGAASSETWTLLCLINQRRNCGARIHAKP
jgi:hypothetical protein